MSKYPDSTRKYWPIYVLLHQCGEDSGCCFEFGHTCVANTTEEVGLHFFVYTKGIPGERAGVMNMSFTNHTSCACKPRDSISSSASYTLRLKQASLGFDGCKCASNFAAKRESGTCICDCLHRDKTCLRYKKGRRFFSPIDTSCIIKGECSEPTCEYGPFLASDGRCPRRREKTN
ncbi:uncharacterized protein LOC143032883 [Oratosquilla oratoria]|uniref:uncharacterized protein LOC143032883 n=1 Tax=Oratosquilla oratoria TaxID=337810 RepID=UPI003F761592